MFIHQHPYPPFIQNDTKKLIVGTLPPPRFTTGELLEKDVDFCYGSYHNSLWKFIDHIHNLNLRFDNSQEAVKQREDFLVSHSIGICDIVERAKRDKIDASDLGMKAIKLRNMLSYLHDFTSIEMLIFIGGNSKNGPEYLFRKQLKENGIKLQVVSNDVPRIHEFELPSLSGHNEKAKGKLIQTVSLSSSSGAANISISRLPLYKQLKAEAELKGATFNTFDFRVQQYSRWL